MSNYLAIAAVTTTLQALLNQGMRSLMDNAIVTALPLDKAAATNVNQINLSLYHMGPKLELGNQPMHPRSRVTHTQPAGAALELYYLIVAYGEEGSEAKSHALLGRVMQVMQEFTTLHPDTIEMSTAREFPDSDLHRQVEAIHITPAALTYDEMSKVWQVLQAQYRPSVAYKVSMVMMDQVKVMGTAMPVVTRSGMDWGPIVYPDQPPVITSLALPNRQPSARLGDRIRIRGKNLDGSTMTVQLRHPLHPEPLELPVQPAEMEMVLPMASDPDAPPWLAGFWTLSLRGPQAPLRSSNAVPLAIAPLLRDLEPLTAPAGNLRLSLTCIPAVHPDQQVMLLWRDRIIPVQQISRPEAGMSRLLFRIREVEPGLYPIRLRVDGVDSLPIDFSTVPWEIDANQQVRVTDP